MSTEERRVAESIVSARIDRIEELLLEIRKTLMLHMEQEALMKPTIDELVTLYRGSKLLTLMLASMAALLGALLSISEWMKAHWK